MALALGEELALLVQAVEAAGKVAHGHFGGTVAQWDKDDGTPVSEADLAANDELAAVLRKARPQYGWVSEEAPPEGDEIAPFFVVDPIDGTSAFLEGRDEWTVVAALIVDGRPVAGAIHQPTSGRTFAACAGGGAHLNGARLAVSAQSALSQSRLAAPGPLFQKAELAREGATRMRSVRSLALRLAHVAEGVFDGAITKPGPHHWDLAAADILVREAGGVFLTLSGEALRYDTSATKHGSIVAGPSTLVDALRAVAVAQAIG